MPQNFYDQWLDLANKVAAEKRRAPKVIHPQELQWVETRQDARAALLVAPETGFRTWGTCTMVAEIPVGWQTGRHSHGEEAIFIVRGVGCSIIDGQRFDWEEGACLRIPFGVVHQHFNLGSEPVHYLSALAPHLEYLCLVSEFRQYADCGRLDRSLPDLLRQEGDRDRQGRRIVLHLKDAPVTHGNERPKSAPITAFHETMPKEMGAPLPAGTRGREKTHLMGSTPDFMGEEVEMTSIFSYRPGDFSMKHAHMEAVLYVIQGEGYSILDEEKIAWEEGAAFHIQGPQTTHQFFATTPSRLLRIHFGIRSRFFQPIAKSRFPYLYLAPGSERPGSGHG